MNKPIPPVLAIVGSRNWPDGYEVRNYVEALPKGTVVVSGGGGAVDATAEITAKRLNRTVQIYRPRQVAGQWRVEQVTRVSYEALSKGSVLPKVYPHFAAAAHARNSMIVNYCVEHGGGLTAFLDETVKSNGTRSTIEKAEKAGVLYEVITYKEAKA